MNAISTRALIKLASALKPFAESRETVSVQGETVGQALQDLIRQYPSFAPVIFQGEGQLNHHLHVYLHQESIRYLKGLDTRLEPGDEISLVPLTQMEGME